MRCEACAQSLGARLICRACGAEGLDARLAYRSQLLLTLMGWQEAGLVTAAAQRTLEVRLRAETRALRRLGRLGAKPEAVPAPTRVAPEPPPVEAPPEPPARTPEAPQTPAGHALPLPASLDAQADEPADGVGAWLRGRIGWVTGVLLTVVGSIYLAGSIWSDLPPLWRQVLVWLYLACCAIGFTRVGRRLQDHLGGQAAARWLSGVAVALVPVHALAVGGIWKLADPVSSVAAVVGLVATGWLHHRLLARALPQVVPELPGAFRNAWLALALSVGVLPLVAGPGWLVVPALGALATLWIAVTRAPRVGWITAVLVAEPLIFHALFTPGGEPGAYGPVLVLAAVGCLYLDAARARWRGLNRSRASGLLGVLSLGLAAGALVVLSTTLAPLPTTTASLGAALLLVGYFAAASASWRRPVVSHGALFAGLLVMLALPAQFALAVQWMAAQAGQALGYTDEPLPLAWYSLTLLPYLAGIRWLEGALGRSGWRQGASLARHALGWGAGLSVALMFAAHSHPDDLRPALLALPLHGALWAWGRGIRHSSWAVLVVLVGGVWVLDGLAWLGVSGDGLMFSAGALVTAVAWSARSWLPGAARAEGGLAVAGLAGLILGLGGLAVQVGASSAEWAAGAGLLALVGVAGVALGERRLPDRVGPRRALEVAAHLLAVVAVIMAAELEPLARTLAKAPVAVALVVWLQRHRHPVYGALISAGLAELTVRHGMRLGLDDPGLLAAAAAGAAWLPVAGRLAGWGARPWLDRALAWPAAWVGGAAAAAALGLITLHGFVTAWHVAACGGITCAVALAAHRLRWTELGTLSRVLATWTAVGLLQWLNVSAEAQGWILGGTATVLLGVAGERRWAGLVWVVAVGATAVSALQHIPAFDVSLPLLALGLGWLGAWLTQRPVLAWVGALAGLGLTTPYPAPAFFGPLSTGLAGGVMLAVLARSGRADTLLRLTLIAALGWLMMERAGAGDPALVALLALHGVGLGLARLRGFQTVPQGAWWVGLPLWAAAVAILPVLDAGPQLPGLLVGVAVAAAWLGRKGLLTWWVPLVAAMLLDGMGLDLSVWLPATWAVLGLALRPKLPWTTVLCLFLAASGDVVMNDRELSTLVLLAPLGAAAWELRRGWVQDQGWRWWTALAWTGWGLVLARVAGPLQGLPETWLLPVAVGLAVVLEGLYAGVEPLKGARFVRPLQVCARALPLVMLGICLPLGGLTQWGLALVGSLSLLRFVFRPRTSDLLLGVVLIDAAALWTLAEAGVQDPVVWVAPLSISLLLVARLLRDALGTQVVAGLRYVAAGALYLAAFGDLIGTPGGSLIMLVLGLVGIAAGAGLRVRAYLHLGAGVAVATLVADALRFGLAHSDFWALYLTALGLVILGAMVAGTLHRDRLIQWRGTLRTAMAGWE